MGKVLIVFDFREEQVERLRKTYPGLDFVTAQGEEEVLANLGDTEVLIPSFRFKTDLLDEAPEMPPTPHDSQQDRRRSCPCVD